MGLYTISYLSMKRFIGFAIALFVVLIGCTTFDSGSVTYENLDTSEGLSAALESGANILVYDVRTAEEYVTGHIPGARNVPYDVIGRRLGFWLKQRVIVVYCQSGGRSMRAYDALTERGFARVTDFGGIGNWEGELVYGKKRFNSTK